MSSSARVGDIRVVYLLSWHITLYKAEREFSFSELGVVTQNYISVLWHFLFFQRCITTGVESQYICMGGLLLNSNEQGCREIFS